MEMSWYSRWASKQGHSLIHSSGGDTAVAVAVGAEVTVPEDGCLWGECVEVLKELTEGRALLGGAGICGMARVI